MCSGVRPRGDPGKVPGVCVWRAHLGSQHVPRLVAHPHQAVVQGIPTLRARRAVQEAEAVAWVAGAGAAPQQPGLEPGVHDAQALQLPGLQDGAHGLGAMQVVQGKAQQAVQRGEVHLRRGTGGPSLAIACLAFVHTVGPQKGPPRLPRGSRAGAGHPVGGQGLGPGQGLLGQGWGRGLRVSRAGPRCPGAAGLGGQQLGADLTWRAAGKGVRTCGVRAPQLPLHPLQNERTGPLGHECHPQSREERAAVAERWGPTPGDPVSLRGSSQMPPAPVNPSLLMLQADDPGFPPFSAER